MTRRERIVFETFEAGKNLDEARYLLARAAVRLRSVGAKTAPASILRLADMIFDEQNRVALLLKKASK